MIGVVLPSSLSIRSDSSHSHLRSLPDQTPKWTFFKPFYLHQSISLPFRCFVVSTEANSSAIPKQCNAVISLFYNYGFSEEQVQRMFHKNPRLLAVVRQKTIRPKLDYILSFGYSEPELVTLISSDPHILNYSLKQRIMHNLNLLKQLLGSEELVKKAISHSSQLLRCNLESYIVPSVEILRTHGVPDKRIAQVLVSFPLVMMQKPDIINSVAIELKQLGMDSSSIAFITGLNAKIAMTQSFWDGKVALFKTFGWSDRDFLLAFKKHPSCILNSEGKIKKMMVFYVEQLGWDPVLLSQKPVLISLSLEKRVFPRCAVLNVLASRGLLGGEVSLPTLLVLSEKSFEANYVMNYCKDISVVRKAYDGMIEGDFTTLRKWEERYREKRRKMRRNTDV